MSDYISGVRSLAELSRALRVLASEARSDEARADLTMLAGSATALAARFERLGPGGRS